MPDFAQLAMLQGRSADGFVAAVSATLGCVMLWSAWRQSVWLFELPKTRWLEQRWGRGPTRCLLAIVGMALIALGGVILSGWRMSW